MLQFHKAAVEILGVQEQHGLVMGADLRLAIAQYARALRFQLVARGVDVLDLVADMMDAAIGKTRSDYAAVRAYLDKNGRANLPIIIGETGWKAADPSGASRYKFLGHPANQKMYYNRLLDWAVASRTDSGPKGIVYFEAFDEPWKGSDDNWGLFNVARQARCVAQALNPSATWTKDTSKPCDEASALYYVPPVLNAAVTQPSFVIDRKSVV